MCAGALGSIRSPSGLGSPVLRSLQGREHNPDVKHTADPPPADRKQQRPSSHRCGGVLVEDDILTVVHFVLFLVHGVDASPGPELQESLEQQPAQVHFKDGGADEVSSDASGQPTVKRDRFTILRFGSDPSELENPASFAETQAAKQSLSSNVMVSIC